MNPDAKEFVPAYILKKRQEEAACLGELTKQLDTIDINSEDKTASTATATTNNTTNNNPTTPSTTTTTTTSDDEDPTPDCGADGDYDSYLLNAGENICEFNGEQFIIPGDDDLDESDFSQPGYDFGNAEDNDNEDVCNAFEEFLGNLPNND